MSRLEQCVILIGGLGTRLGPLTSERPKPLLDVGGAPFLSVLIEEAARKGFKRVLLLAGYKAEQVTAFAAEMRRTLRWPVSIDVSVEPQPLGTAGALHHAAGLLEERFLLMNGDSWFDFNWLDLDRALAQAGGDCIGALSLRPMEDASRYGVVLTEGERAVRFAERGSPDGGLVNGGVYVLRREICAFLPPSGSLEAEVLPRLAQSGRLAARAYDAFFIDIGVPADFARAQADVPAQRRRPAAFLDRDGVLNVDRGYTHRPEDLAFVEGAADAVRRLNAAGYYAMVVTNQAGVARGYYPETAVGAFHEAMQAALREAGAYVYDWRYCPYHPEGAVERYRRDHDWRKPRAGMILDLMSSWPIEAKGSFLIGDKESDLIAGRAAGVASYLYSAGNLDRLVESALEDRFAERAERSGARNPR